MSSSLVLGADFDGATFVIEKRARGDRSRGLFEYRMNC